MNQSKILKIILFFIGLLIIITSGIFVIQTLKDLDNLKFSQVKEMMQKHSNNVWTAPINLDTYHRIKLTLLKIIQSAKMNSYDKTKKNLFKPIQGQFNNAVFKRH